MADDRPGKRDKQPEISTAYLLISRQLGSHCGTIIEHLYFSVKGHFSVTVSVPSSLSRRDDFRFVAAGEIGAPAPDGRPVDRVYALR